MPDRDALLRQICEVSFMVNDLTLYLDTHPLDENGLDQFEAFIKQRKELLGQYAEHFEPLTNDCVCTVTNNQSKQHTPYAGRKHFTWSDGPLPWDAYAPANGGL